MLPYLGIACSVTGSAERGSEHSDISMGFLGHSDSAPSVVIHLNKRLSKIPTLYDLGTRRY